MIRALLPGDAEATAQLIRDAFAALSAPIDPPPSALRVTGASVRAHLEAGGGGALSTTPRPGPLREGEGEACVLWSVREGGLYVGRLAVRPAARGRGIASVLLAHAEEVARAMGLPRIHLEVRLALADNRRLFRRAGFVEGAQHAHPGYDHPTFVAAEKWL